MKLVLLGRMAFWRFTEEWWVVLGLSPLKTFDTSFV
jgi:hypothetical protein